jgi:hypothetical protein
MTRRPIALISALVVCAAFILSACSNPKSAPPTTAAGKTTTTLAGKPTSTTTTSPIPIQNNVKIRTQAVITKCQAADGGWMASGTATNPGTQSHTYQLIVYFTDAHATVIGSAKTSVSVASKAAGTWSATAKFHAPTVVRCVLVGVE